MIFSFIMYGILTKKSDFIIEITLIMHETTVPSTVASAAPIIPKAGKPQ